MVVFVVLWAIFEGVLGKVMFSRGVFVVKLWWKRGGLWRVDGPYLRAKNTPLF